MSSRRNLHGASPGASLLPLRMRRQLAAVKTTPSRVTAAPPVVERDDSDDDDCCIIVPDPPKKKVRLVEVPDEDTASTSSATHETARTVKATQSEDGQDTSSDGRTEKSRKTFQSSDMETLSARIRKNLQYLRQGRETAPSPVPQQLASDDDDVASMSVAELMKKAKGMVALTNENKELKNKLAEFETRFKSLETRMHQKEGLVSQYESEIETMTELLKDAENELDQAHKERMMKGHSSEEVNKLNKQLQSQKEAQETQDQAMNELQRQLKASQAETKSLKSSLTRATEASHRDEKDLTKKTQEIVKLKQALKDAEASLAKEKAETKKANEAEQKVKSEMIYKCSMLTLKTEKLQKEEREVAGYQEKLKRSEEIRRKALDVTNMCYSTIGAMAKELNQCKKISRSLSNLLQEIQVKLVDRQLKQILDGAGRTDITMDQNLKEVLEKIWEVQKQLRPVILIDIKDDNVGNIRSNVSEAPIIDTTSGTNGRGRGRGRGKGRSRSNPTVALPSAPAITNIPGDMTEFEQKTQQNNKLLLQCLDLLAAAHNDVSSKETQLAGLSVQLNEVRKNLQTKDECYTIHVYEQSKDKEAQNEASDVELEDDTVDKPMQRVVTTFSAVPKPLDSTSPIKERRSSANITVIPADEAAQEKMNVRMECESDGEIDEGSRTLGIQTEPIKDHVLVLVDSDDEHPVVISDSEDELNQTADSESRSIGIGATTTARYRPDTNSKDDAKDSNPSSPVKALLTNVTTIPQSLFDNFSTPSDAVSSSPVDGGKTKNGGSENIETSDAEMNAAGKDESSSREGGKDEDTSSKRAKFMLTDFDIDFDGIPNCKESDRIKALELIEEIEGQVVDLSRGPPTARYTIQQIMMTRIMLKNKKVGLPGVRRGDTKGASAAEGNQLGSSKGDVKDTTSRSDSDVAETVEGVAKDLGKEEGEQSVLSLDRSTSPDVEQSKVVDKTVENGQSSEGDADDQVTPPGDEPSQEVENNIIMESLSVMKSLAEDAERLFDFDNKKGKVDDDDDDDAEPPSGQGRKRSHSENVDDEDDDDDAEPPSGQGRKRSRSENVDDEDDDDKSEKKPRLDES